MDEKIFKEILEKLSDGFMSDLELYRINFDNKLSMMELFFDSYFRKVEGTTCACDKSRFTVKRINKYLMTGVNENLQETYREYQLKGNNIGGITELDRICYWCPKSIKTAEEAIKILFHYLCIDDNYFKQIKLESGNNE